MTHPPRNSATTPTPWTTYRPVHRAVEIIQGPNYEVIAELPTLTGHSIDGAPPEQDKRKGNAALIVRAVNSHEEMVECLKASSKLIRRLMGEGTIDPLDAPIGITVGHIEDAIAKAEGK